MHFKITTVLFLFIFIINMTSYADDGEKFKDICVAINKDFTEMMSYEKDSVPPEIEKKFENTYLIQSERLKAFVETNPESIWADDAQYILSALKAGYPDQGAIELEYLLEHYPNMAIEEWTKENLTWLIPVDLQLAVRVALLMHYKETDGKDKLKALYDESIKKFPEKAELYEKIINYKK